MGARTRGGRLLACAAALALTAGCTSSDDAVFRDVGVTRLFLLDLALDLQALPDGRDRIQVAEWEIGSARLFLDGRELDLRAGEPCRIVDTVATLPVPRGRCAAGIVIEAKEEPQRVHLSLALTMQLRRAKPVELPPLGDHDGDGVANVMDNCPLLANEMQEDSNDDGLGDACSTIDFITGGAIPDSDGDGIADRSDNCLHVANPTQTDTMGVSAEGFPDFIGDACQEQVARVHVAGNLDLAFDFGPADLVQNRGQVSAVVVDFNHLGALSCNWAFGVCSLDASRVRFCVVPSATSANLGCR